MANWKNCAQEIAKLGGELSAQRRKAIPKLAKAAVQQLRDLGFKQSHFDICDLRAAAATSRRFRHGRD